MNITTRIVAMTAIALSCAASPAFADDDSNDSFRALSAQWWQWAASIPLARNPLADTTGVNCMVGQRGPVWFLAGNTTGGSVTRTCTVPEGVTLFFPVVNVINVNTPNIGQGGQDKTIADLRAEAAPIVDGAQRIKVLLDNREIKHVRRVRSIAFPTVFAQDNFFGNPEIVSGFPYAPSIDDGYYVKLRGLSEGAHHLRFQGELPAFGFSLSVDYMLNVVKVQLKD